MPGGIVAQKFNRFCGYSFRIIKRNKCAALVVQEFDRVQVGRRNDGLAGAQGVRQRAGNNLRFMFVRRDVNVRRAN